MKKLATSEELRQHADITELHAIDFLDKRGRIAKAYGQPYITVRLTFIDGKVLVISRDVMERDFMNYNFTLRPKRNNS